MAEDKAKANPPRHETPVAELPVMTNDQVLRLLLSTQQQLAESQKALADALLESRKPYVDPKVLEARRDELKQREEQVRIELKRRELTKKVCHHHRVDSEGNQMPRLNIKWMQHSNNIVLGTCGTCFSQFDARNPKDLAYLRQDPTAINNMGRARGIGAK